MPMKKARAVANSLDTALGLYQAGKLRECELLLARRLKLAPRDEDALQFHGMVLLQLGRPELAMESLRRAANINPGNAPLWTHLGDALRQVGLKEEAAAAQQRAIDLQPDLVEAYLNLGIVQSELKILDQAIASFERAVQLRPNAYGLQFHLADALRLGGLPERAAQHYRLALQLSPEAVPALLGLAEVGVVLGRLSEAATAATKACHLDPGSAVAAGYLAQVLFAQGAYEACAAAAARACQLNPTSGEAHKWLGMALVGCERPGEAAPSLKRACELSPQSVVAHTYVVTASFLSGELDDALEFAQRGLALKASPSLHSALLFMMPFHPRFTQRELSDAARQWAERYAPVGLSGAFAWPNVRDPARKLRVGYVAPTFRNHCQALYLAPLLAAHDRNQVQVIGYASVEHPDAVTELLKSRADEWYDTAQLDDAELLHLIRSHRVDILVDLTMHMTGARLSVFAERAAPVQVCWLAYPGSTGLSQIDYRLSDRYLDPPRAVDGGPRGDDSHAPERPVIEALAEYSETSVILPDTFWCYDPLTQGPPVGPLPALTHGFVTFGCLNNYAKVNDQVLVLWAQVLHAVSDSRLLVRVPAGAPRVKLLARMAQLGIPAERLELVDTQPRDAYLATYAQIDVCLDPFPSNGHTVSLDAFWMGVPVVTLVGTTLVGRAGLCQASNLGLPELIAWSEAEYVAAAVALTRDLTQLATLRSTLRARLEASPLMDGPRFAQNIETAYRMLWQRWCETDAGLEHRE